jgi:ribosomal silencing factor RsfS
VLEQRDADLNQSEKLRFFETLQCLADQDEPRLEMMKLSEVAKAKLISGVFRYSETKKLLADLILISINKNQGHVKAIAKNYRESHVVAKKPKSKRKKNDSIDKVAVDTKEPSEECMVVETEDEQYSDVEPD